MPPRKPPETDLESDDEDEESIDDEDDDSSEDGFEFEDEEDEDDVEEDEDDAEDDAEDEDDAEEGSGERGAGGRRKDPSDCSPPHPASAEGTSRPPASDESPPRRPRARREPQTRARGPGGMGRPSTGPAIRRSSTRDVELPMTGEEEPITELAPDIMSWPGTAEAARMVGKHTSTIKAWRTQGRIRAQQDQAGCWRYHPDDLAEAIDTPEGTDPGSILAQGMTAIVSQGASANERLLAMTELATDGLKDATSVLSAELRRAYTKIAELEKELAELRRQQSTERGEELKHERFIRKLDHKHELDLVGAKETSERLNGLLTVLGPIAASIGQRVLGNIAGAERSEAQASGFGPQASGFSGAAPPNPRESSSGAETGNPKPETSSGAGGAPDMPFEARITQAMARLCDVIRRLDGPAFAGLRAMMPEKVATALDDVKQAVDDGTVGRALAVIVQASQGLSDLQFRTLKPIAPADIAAVLGELRELLKDVKFQPESPPS